MSRDFAWKSYKRFARPEPYHIVQEIQKYVRRYATYGQSCAYRSLQAQSAGLSATENTIFASYQKDSSITANAAKSWFCLLADRRKSRKDYQKLRYDTAEVIRSLNLYTSLCVHTFKKLHNVQMSPRRHALLISERSTRLRLSVSGHMLCILQGDGSSTKSR